ncbi:hypothetical protein VTK56DRAFT_8144 [Thermocarpiscus australiensis]
MIATPFRPLEPPCLLLACRGSHPLTSSPESKAVVYSVVTVSLARIHLAASASLACPTLQLQISFATSQAELRDLATFHCSTRWKRQPSGETLLSRRCRSSADDHQGCCASERIGFLEAVLPNWVSLSRAKQFDNQGAFPGVSTTNQNEWSWSIVNRTAWGQNHDCSFSSTASIPV